MNKSLAAQLWAMTGPAEGQLVYGVDRGQGWWETTSDIRVALEMARGAVAVREFWRLD